MIVFTEQRPQIICETNLKMYYLPLLLFKVDSLVVFYLNL